MWSDVALAVLSAATIYAAPILSPNQDVPQSLQSILDNTHNSDAYTYPTDLTRNIVPVSNAISIASARFA